MSKLPTPQQVIELGARCEIIRKFLCLWANGMIGWEQALVAIVYELAIQSQAKAIAQG